MFLPDRRHTPERPQDDIHVLLSRTFSGPRKNCHSSPLRGPLGGSRAFTCLSARMSLRAGGSVCLSPPTPPPKYIGKYQPSRGRMRRSTSDAPNSNLSQCHKGRGNHMEYGVFSDAKCPKANDELENLNVPTLKQGTAAVTKSTKFQSKKFCRHRQTIGKTHGFARSPTAAETKEGRISRPLFRDLFRSRNNLAIISPLGGP